MATRSEALADTLTQAILRGEWAPGVRMPPVRALADTHGVNASTVQRALVLLNNRGLVRMMERTGVEVRDPTQHGTLALWPLLVRTEVEDPASDLSFFIDALRLRRVLTADAARSAFTEIHDAERLALADHIQAFVDGFKADTPTARWQAESALLRHVVLASGRPAMVGGLNAVEQVLAGLPRVVDAIFADPTVMLASWSQFGQLLRTPPPPELLMPFIEQHLAAGDERVLQSVRVAYGRTAG